jgi:hypothetical protein
LQKKLKKVSRKKRNQNAVYVLCSKNDKLELFNANGSMNDSYKNKWKALAFNLKKNADLRQAVMNKSISVRELITMTPQDVCFNEWF